VSCDLLAQSMKETIGRRVQEQTEKVGLEACTGESIRLQSILQALDQIFTLSAFAVGAIE
jgi:hypothetical protein